MEKPGAVSFSFGRTWVNRTAFELHLVEGYPGILITSTIGQKLQALQTLLEKKNNAYFKCYLHVNLKIHNLLYKTA
jgi:hypothetical protein